ncbi:hypothetical protein LJK88_50015 [Paenibacillus sp. P26]|nr:hypothetical protein LJK88_50015 [Paenibacillus sp. P26]
MGEQGVCFTADQNLLAGDRISALPGKSAAVLRPYAARKHLPHSIRSESPHEFVRPGAVALPAALRADQHELLLPQQGQPLQQPVRRLQAGGVHTPAVGQHILPDGLLA